jgi:hypothetical protein
MKHPKWLYWQPLAGIMPTRSKNRRNHLAVNDLASGTDIFYATSLISCQNIRKSAA